MKMCISDDFLYAFPLDILISIDVYVKVILIRVVAEIYQREHDEFMQRTSLSFEMNESD